MGWKETKSHHLITTHPSTQAPSWITHFRFRATLESRTIIINLYTESHEAENLLAEDFIYSGSYHTRSLKTPLEISPKLYRQVTREAQLIPFRREMMNPAIPVWAEEITCEICSFLCLSYFENTWWPQQLENKQEVTWSGEVSNCVISKVNIA